MRSWCGSCTAAPRVGGAGANATPTWLPSPIIRVLAIQSATGVASNSRNVENWLARHSLMMGFWQGPLTCRMILL